MKAPFYINQQFFIEPDSNSVTEKINGKRTRLEGRFMQVLCMLVEKRNETITREELISAIWLNYGGGDDALTQAISALRKVLLDGNKQLIDTVPKKGYIFTGTISYRESKNEIKPDRFRLIFKQWIAGISIAAIFVVAVIIYFMATQTSGKANQTEVPYPVNLAREDAALENETNTITTTAPDNTVYKLVIIGDRPPKFYINDQRVLEDKWEPYMSLINSLKRKLMEKEKSVK